MARNRDGISPAVFHSHKGPTLGTLDILCADYILVALLWQGNICSQKLRWQFADKRHSKHVRFNSMHDRSNTHRSLTNKDKVPNVCYHMKSIQSVYTGFRKYYLYNMAYFKSIYTCFYGYMNGCCPNWLILSDNYGWAAFPLPYAYGHSSHGIANLEMSWPWWRWRFRNTTFVHLRWKRKLCGISM